MMERLVLAAALALGLGGCGATAVVGAAATVVATGVKVAGSAVSATVDVAGSAISGAIDLATSDDDEKADGKSGADSAAKSVMVNAAPESPAVKVEPLDEAEPSDATKTVEADHWETVDSEWDVAD